MQKIPLDEPLFLGNEKKYLSKCIESGWISWQGEFVSKFEKAIAKYLNVKYAITASSGTAANHLALAALGIKDKDEIIVPTLSFITTSGLISSSGAKNIFADCSPGKFYIDQKKVKEKITGRTKAIIAVHLYGRPADMDALAEIAGKNEICLIEDCSQSVGAEYKKEKTGSIGDVNYFSLYNKTIAAGEGGVVATNNKDIFEKINYLRAPPEDNRSKSSVLNFSYRMSNLQAAVALAQLEKIDELIARRRRNAKLYLEFLGKSSSLEIVPEDKNTKSVYWRNNILLNNSANISRDRLIKKLKRQGIQTRPVYSPVHLHPFFANMSNGKFPVAEMLSRQGIDLPSSPRLGKSEIEFISSKILSLCKN